MADNSKEDLVAFVDKVDALVDEMESHPELSNYYIGVVAQLKNVNSAARRDIDRA